MLQYEFRVEFLKADVVVFIGVPDKPYKGKYQFKKLAIDDIANSWNNKNFGGHSVEYSNESGHIVNVIWLAWFELPTLVHEVSHVVDKIMGKHNIPTGYESTEVRALLNDYIFNEVYKMGTPTDWAKRKGKPKHID